MWSDFAVIKNLQIHHDDLHDGGVIASFDYVGDEKLGREHIDGDFEFVIELADVEPATGPHGTVMRPWGNLEKRMRSMHQAVLEYTSGLVAIALDAEPVEGAGG